LIKSVQIQNLRGIQNGTVEGLSPLSILVGPNNCGKSTCLEAISIVSEGNQAAAVIALLLRRGGPSLDALGNVVTPGAKEAEVSMTLSRSVSWVAAKTTIRHGGTQQVDWPGFAKQAGVSEPMDFLDLTWKIEDAKGAPERQGRAVAFIDDKGNRTGNLLVEGDAFKPYDSRLVDVEAVRGRSALEDAYTAVDRAGELENVVSALRTSLPDLQTLKILKSGDNFLLHLFLSSSPPVPAYVAGDGFKRFLQIAAASCEVKRGVLLLEEPESFQHPRYLGELAELLLRMAGDERQIVLSTHSIELIDLLLTKAGERDLPFPTVHRLRLKAGRLGAVALGRSQAMQARETLLEDLRA